MKETAGSTLRVATYNVHGCVGRDRQRSETRIAEVIAELSVDVIGLQELDLNRTRSAGMDQAGIIAGQLGWHWHFQAAMQSGAERYGHAILSRHPLTLRQGACLPGKAPFFCRETRAALAMDVAADFGRVHLINTHLGLGRGERLLQSQMLTSAAWLDSSADGLPLVLLGDFNSLPGSRPHRALSQHLRDVRQLVRPGRPFRTFPTWFPAFAVDHILINEAFQATNLTVHRSPISRMASDHFPLVAELVVTSSQR